MIVKREQIVIDIDGTLTLDGDVPDFYELKPHEVEKLFSEAKPNQPLIDKLNKLDKKYVICLWTARSDVYQDVTIKWLHKHKVKYHHVVMNKPFGKYYVDDKFMSPEDFIEL